MRRDETGRPPALTRAERERTRRSREALVDGGVLTAPPGRCAVPREIERSWRRCVGEAVPVAPETIDYREPDGDDMPILRRAAGPVLDRLADSFADVPVAMVLSDATGRIVMRHVDVRRQRDTMDRASAAEGFDFSERSIGTNGLGTALVERRPILVRGPEHYNALLEDITCAGTPVVEPVTGRLLGSFSLACFLRDVHPLMTVMAADIGRQIESRILDESGERHRRLVRAYLAAGTAGTGALVVDSGTVLANRLGLAHTGPELHPLLWRFLAEHGPTTARRMQVPLSDGRHDALVEPIDDGARTAWSIRLLPRRPGHPETDGGPGRCVDRTDRADPMRSGHPDPVRAGRRVRAEKDGGFGPRSGRADRGGSAVRSASPESGGEDGTGDTSVGPLHVDDDVHRELVTALRHGETVALTGGPGTGKLHTALRTLAWRDAAAPLVVEPHLDPGWFAAAREAVAAGRPVVVRRVHVSPSPTPPQLEALVASGAPIALTADLAAADDTVVGTVRRIATTVRLPGLAQHREHLPALVRSVLADQPEPLRSTRFATPVWERLMDRHWPGDVAELRTTVVALARRCGGGTVELEDLPDELRASRRALGAMESAEREAVVDALRAAAGNRSHAARRLGIGRTTLYRKMREFGLG